MLSHRFRASVLLTIAAVTLAGCGSKVEGSARPGEMDVRTLDVGKYQTDPLDLRHTYSPTMSDGFALALQRLADHVAYGYEIDPAFGYGTGVVPFLDSDTANKVLARSTLPALDSNKMMFGISVGQSDKQPDKTGQTPDDSAFTALTVMQFPDAAAASKAAGEIEDADFGVAADLNQRVTLPKYPDAHSHWRPGVATIGSTMAHGSYVVNLYLGVKDPDLSQLTALAQKAYDAQLPLLDSLPPLDREGVLRLPYDPDAMLRRTLNPDDLPQPDFLSQAVADSRGFLHRVSDQTFWRKLLSDNQVDRYAISGMSYSGSSMLFRTTGIDRSRSLAAGILDHGYSGVADEPPGIPDAKCGESATASQDSGAKRFRCVVSYRQYAAMVESDQLADVHQRAAAQYALLANSTW
ncbi:DUF7373 family lipoprotein [Nocardia heshunensis]